MDVFSHISFSTDNVNELHTTHGVSKLLSVDELGVGVTELLSIQDINEDPTTPPPRKICETAAVSDKSPPNATTSEISKAIDQTTCISVTTGLKPISAMKGSREKRGAAPTEKLTVKWAPDVYDPVPSSVSHVITNNKRHSSSSKKSSKNKQKKPSRGTKGKEKKHVRKRSGGGGSSNKFEVDEEVVDFPELLCGSSFLKRYGTGMHVSSVAEAT